MGLLKRAYKNDKLLYGTGSLSLLSISSPCIYHISTLDHKSHTYKTLHTGTVRAKEIITKESLLTLFSYDHFLLLYAMYVRNVDKLTLKIIGIIFFISEVVCVEC